MKKLFFIIIGLVLTSQNTWALPTSQCKTMGKNLSVQSQWYNNDVTYIDCVSEKPLTISNRGNGWHPSPPLPPIPPHAVLPNSKVTVTVYIHHNNKHVSFSGNIGNGLNISCMGDPGAPSCTCNGNPCSTQ